MKWGIVLICIIHIMIQIHFGKVNREKIDGSNCQTAGDLVCDTPADPLLN